MCWCGALLVSLVHWHNSRLDQHLQLSQVTIVCCHMGWEGQACGGGGGGSTLVRSYTLNTDTKTVYFPNIFTIIFYWLTKFIATILGVLNPTISYLYVEQISDSIPLYQGPQFFNTLNFDIRNCSSVSTFNSKFWNFLLCFTYVKIQFLSPISEFRVLTKNFLHLHTMPPHHCTF